MYIAIIGANRIDSMEWHLADALNFMGHYAKIFDIYDRPIFHSAIKSYATAFDKFRRTYSDRYDINRFDKQVKLVNQFDPDLIICLYKDIHPCFVDKVKKPHRKVIHLNPDTFTTLGYQQVFASNYDAWFVKDKYMLNFMRNNMRLNTYIYSEAFNQRYNSRPNTSKLDIEKEVNIDVSTYGTLYPYRTRMVSNLIDAGINIKLFGTIPHRFFLDKVRGCCTGEYITGEKKAKIIYGSKIIFNNLHYAEIESVNCRFYEINGCGGFQLCDYRDILHDLLPKEVDPREVSFIGINEAIDKIKYYLLHDSERIEIADKIQIHFQKNYTYDNLVSYLIEVVSAL